MFTIIQNLFEDSKIYYLINMMAENLELAQQTISIHYINLIINLKFDFLWCTAVQCAQKGNICYLKIHQLFFVCYSFQQHHMYIYVYVSEEMDIITIYTNDNINRFIWLILAFWMIYVFSAYLLTGIILSSRKIFIAKFQCIITNFIF